MNSRQQMPNHTTTYEFYAETVVDYRDLPPQFKFQDIDSLFQLAHKNERPPSRPPTRSTGKANSVSNTVATLITFVSLLVLLLGVTVSAAKWIAQRKGPLSPLEELRSQESTIDNYLYYFYPRCTGYQTKCTWKAPAPGSHIACWTTWASCHPPAWGTTQCEGPNHSRENQRSV